MVDLLMRDHEHPPTEWLGSTIRISDDIYASWFTSVTDPNPVVWHWCPTEQRWSGAGTPDHTLVSREPLHLEPSLLMSWCCGLHGWIRDGEWVGA